VTIILIILILIINH